MAFDIDKVLMIIKETADQEILPRFGKLLATDISYKPGIFDRRDPVTSADEKTEQTLTKRFRELVPGVRILGEESHTKNPALINFVLEDDPVFIIDPLDGTRNFANGHESFFTLVAYMVRQEIVAGIIYHPLSGESLIAEKGGGAWYKGKKLTVPAPVSLDEAHGTLGRRVWEQAPETIQKLQTGFASLGINPNSGLAAPRLLMDSPYFGSDDRGAQCHFRVCPMWSMPWDDAPALIAYSEAGGHSTHWNGEAYRMDAFGQGLIMAPDQQMIADIRQVFEPYNLRSRLLDAKKISSHLSI